MNLFELIRDQTFWKVIFFTEAAAWNRCEHALEMTRSHERPRQGVTKDLKSLTGAWPPWEALSASNQSRLYELPSRQLQLIMASSCQLETCLQPLWTHTGNLNGLDPWFFWELTLGFLFDSEVRQDWLLEIHSPRIVGSSYPKDASPPHLFLFLPAGPWARNWS